jgi:AraC family transcriptional regulator of adaptative response/methylated-DNA-[protein]-cysteine methyltransferase
MKNKIQLQKTKPQHLEISNSIQYLIADTDFGKIILATTKVGICYISFVEDENWAIEELKKTFPKSELIHKKTSVLSDALVYFDRKKVEKPPITLHISATDFQLLVWEALLQIPYGKKATYLEISNAIGKPKAFRAVGNAIGKNPIALIIPCHRIVQTSGKMGGYKWGVERKKNILRLECEE